MANPLDDKAAAQGFARQMRVGDERLIQIRDNKGLLIKTLNLKRTNRPYAFDLCDAYNMINNPELAAEARSDVIWMVGNDGNPHIQFSQNAAELKRELDAKAEAERSRWKQGQAVPSEYGG